MAKKPKKESVAGEMPTPVADRGKVDFQKLRDALGNVVDDRAERYSFSWAGKRDAIRLLQTPSRATLVPCSDESVNWDSTKNLFIEGDNLEVLKLLYKSYAGRVKLIYIDPPYNTGQDFIYPDNFADPLDIYLKLTGQKDANGNLLTSNPETNGRYHSVWLSMLYPRLFLARQLMADDGVILVSIDDTEVHNLRLVLNELFGEENFVAHIVWQKRYVSNMTAKFLSDMHDHILVFARNINSIGVNKQERSEEQLTAYKNPDNDPRGPWRAQDLSASKFYKAGQFTITTPAGLKCDPPPGRYWRCNERQYNEWVADDRIWFGVEGTARPMLKAFLSEAQDGVTPNTWWSHEFAGHNKEATLELKELFDGAAPFDTPKPVKLIRRILETFCPKDGLVLDFFAGSVTTAHAVLELNHEDGGSRSFVMVQLPEKTDADSVAAKGGFSTIAAIGRDRIKRAIKRIKRSGNGKLQMEKRETPEDLGFRSYKLAPSHNRQWSGVPERDTEALAKQMALFVDPLLPGWKPLPVIHEVAMREGYSLSCRVEELPKKTTKPNTVYRVTDPEKYQAFRICLDDRVNPGIAKALELGTDDLFICRDVALNDEIAANLALQCRLKTI
jgi:adenine-specific DNA-methyltransferase